MNGSIALRTNLLGQAAAARLQAHGMDAKHARDRRGHDGLSAPGFDPGYFKDKETLCREFGLDPAKRL